MTLAIFPTAIKIAYPIRMREHWRTLINSSEGGVEQRIAKWVRPLREIDLECVLMERSAEADVLFNFLRARKGSFEPFLFTFPYERSYEKEWVGVGNGSATVWRLPFKSVDAYNIYVDGVLKTVTTHYTISIGTGLGGSDVLTMVTPPAAGAVVTADATNATCLPVVRLADVYEDEYVYHGRFNARVQLIEVKDEVT